MKIGVLGATGLAGRAVIKLALSRNYEVTAIVRNLQQ
jgi:Putative NADH-flavin reductase